MLSHGLRPRHVVTVLTGTTLVSAVVWHLFTRTGRLLPSPAWLTAVVVLVLAGLVLWGGWQVRQYQRGRARRSLSGLRAARILSLSQAGALTGAAVAGWFLGHLAILLPDRDLTPYGRQIVPLLVLIASGVVLAIAGLVAQHWCRLPPGGRDARGGSDERDDGSDLDGAVQG
ncbi:DUF3180 family protein [Nostocoides sp. F2B08]|uniref:DUF3180 domain-containing protein n=1 Tax=Nostocoides sp. F2B08 TaxID=2653936 RepID=UPI001263A4CD|nr:DUF3180 domain-containing protein [Tetrasphaera sp. F2B08]KAB7746494.1 DUF3180 family protein [Tetrasphaera sp. F2B08]